MHAGAVAGLAVGIHRAAVPHRLQRVDAGLHHLSPRLAVQRGDQADAAGIVLGQVDMRGEASRSRLRLGTARRRGLVLRHGAIHSAHGRGHAGLDVGMIRWRVAAVAEAPDHQRGAAQMSPAGTRRAAPSSWSGGPPSRAPRVTVSAVLEHRGRSSGSKPSALLARSAFSVKEAPGIAPPAGAPVASAGRMHALRRSPHAAIAEEGFRRGEPFEVTLLPRRPHLAHEPACSPCRGGKAGDRDGALAQRGATQSIAVSPPPIRRHACPRVQRAGVDAATASPSPSVGGDEVVQRRHPPAQPARARDVARLVDAGGGPAPPPPPPPPLPAPQLAATPAPHRCRPRCSARSDAALRILLGAAQHESPLQLEVGMRRSSADGAVVPVIVGDLIALPRSARPPPCRPAAPTMPMVSARSAHRRGGSPALPRRCR